MAASDLNLPEQSEQEEQQEKEKPPSLSDETVKGLINIFKDILGEQVTDVRITDRLTNSVARLVDTKGSLGQEMQRVYRMMDKEYQIPKKVLEINPDHPVLKKVSQLPDDDPRRKLIVEQIFESALLIEGLHPDPASMIPRIQQLMESAMEVD